MNIVIVGLGEVGTHLAKVLAAEGHSVSVVDPDTTRLRRVTDAIDVRAVRGDGSRPDVLEQADAGSADLLLAVSNSDNVNMLVCLFGKRMGAKKGVMRVKDMTPFQRFRTFFRKNLMFDAILSLEDLAAEEVTKALRENQVVGIENFAEGKIQMRRLKLPPDSPWLDKPLKALKLPNGVLITALQHGEQVAIPDGETTISKGDEVYVLGEPKAVAGLEKKSGAKSAALRKIAMYGSTGVVRQVATACVRQGVDVRVFVEDKEQANELAARVTGALVLHADPTDLASLREERVGEIDAFLGLSEQDEKNLMSCQLARSLGVERTVALVHKPDYVAIYEKLGIDVAVSPRLLCANKILSFVRSGSISTIATVGEGKAEILELEVQPGSKLIGRTLAKSGFPKGCIVAAIAREDGEILIPKGDDEVKVHDNLVIAAMREVIEDVIALAGVAIAEEE